MLMIQDFLKLIIQLLKKSRLKLEVLLAHSQTAAASPCGEFICS